jgi:integrase
MTKRSFGDGGIDERGEGRYRLRYRHNGKRFSKAFRGSISEARKELRRLIKSGDDGEHIDPSKVTVATWIDRWIILNQRHDVEADGSSRRGLVNRRTLERYEELLRCHVTPTLGKRPLQKLQGTEIDDLYVALEKKLSPRTVHHVHVVLGACLKAAVRKGLITSSPVARAEAPSAGESDHGIALDEAQLRTLLDGFRSSTLFPIVAVLAFTGARRFWPYAGPISTSRKRRYGSSAPSSRPQNSNWRSRVQRPSAASGPSRSTTTCSPCYAPSARSCSG